MSTQALMLSIATILAWGVGSVFDKIATNSFSSPLTVASIRAVFIGGAFISYGLAAGRYAEIATVPRVGLIAVIISATIGPVVGQACYFLALSSADASRIVPITSTYPVVTALLAILFLGERLTWSKGVGVLLIVAGIMLLAGVFGGNAAAK
jgi:bacterial/archaeal transporter family protein